MTHDMGFGYSQHVDWSQFTKKELDLLEKLPHGSGINGTWYAEKRPSNMIAVYNCFSAIDDVSQYCHDWEFSVIIDPGDLDSMDTIEFPDDPNQCACGYDLETYLLDTIYECLTM